MNFIDEAYLEVRAGDGGSVRLALEEKNIFHLVVPMVEMEAKAEIFFLKLMKTPIP